MGIGELYYEKEKEKKTDRLKVLQDQRVEKPNCMVQSPRKMEESRDMRPWVFHNILLLGHKAQATYSTVSITISPLPKSPMVLLHNL